VGSRLLLINRIIAVGLRNKYSIQEYVEYLTNQHRTMTIIMVSQSFSNQENERENTNTSSAGPPLMSQKGLRQRVKEWGLGLNAKICL
jgi:hypothetical protein